MNEDLTPNPRDDGRGAAAAAAAASEMDEYDGDDDDDEGPLEFKVPLSDEDTAESAGAAAGPDEVLPAAAEVGSQVEGSRRRSVHFDSCASAHLVPGSSEEGTFRGRGSGHFGLLSGDSIESSLASVIEDEDERAESLRFRQACARRKSAPAFSCGGPPAGQTSETLSPDHDKNQSAHVIKTRKVLRSPPPPAVSAAEDPALDSTEAD